MLQTLQTYRQALIDRRVDPVRRWDGRSTGKLLDHADAAVPLMLLDLDAFALSETPTAVETADREWLVVPISGTWRMEVSVGAKVCRFAGERTGGPFAAWPDRCNAQVVYVPRSARFELAGAGEAIAFSGPAFADKPPAFVQCDGDHPLVPRGTGAWLRDVVTLATPNDLTTNLVFGETYSPPALWSGTPLHVHDALDPAAGQSDHEEIYYHLAPEEAGATGRSQAPPHPRPLSRQGRGEPPHPRPLSRQGRGEHRWQDYGVQLLFDDQGLDEAYLVHHRTAFAIPGGAHPVVAGPNAPMMYVWCLAAESAGPLGMLDVPRFAWLKRVGAIVDQLAPADGPPASVTRGRLAELAAAAGLDASQRRVLESHLRLCGVRVSD